MWAPVLPPLPPLSVIRLTGKQNLSGRAVVQNRENGDDSPGEVALTKAPDNYQIRNIQI